MTHSASGFSAIITDAEIRDLSFGKLRLVDRIYFAVRNVDWHVLPIEWSQDSGGRAETPGVDRWRGTVDWDDVRLSIDLEIKVVSDQVTVDVSGTAQAAFAYARMGIFVILPVRRFQGRTVTGSGRSSWRDVLPVLVGPQRVEDGQPRALFPPHEQLLIELDEGRLALAFEGDEFEVEDERNWTEMGFKIYAGPLETGWPLSLSAGDEFHQRVSITFEADTLTGDGPCGQFSQPLVTVDKAREWSLPLIGHKAATLGRPLDEQESHLLAGAGSDFVFVEFRERDPDRLDVLCAGLAQAAAINASAAVALFAETTAIVLLHELAAAVGRGGTRLAALFLFHDTGTSEDTERSGTPPSLATASVPPARSLFPGVPLFIGSELNLAEFNRSAPSLHGASGFSVGMSPSGHADETWAILRNLPAQGDALRTLRMFEPEAMLCAGPISLQIPEGGGPRPPGATPWPPSVDPRQSSRIAAAWTLGSLTQIMAAGAEYAIYFETLGWRGLAERSEGSPAPFPSLPGQEFPVLELFRELRLAREGRVLQTRTPDGVSALCYEYDGELVLLLANHSDEPAVIWVEVVPGAGEGHRLGAQAFEVPGTDFRKVWLGR